MAEAETLSPQCSAEVVKVFLCISIERLYSAERKTFKFIKSFHFYNVKKKLIIKDFIYFLLSV